MISTSLASGVVCQGCGKVFANTRRLRRHLTRCCGCRSLWGRFVPAQDTAAAHPQMPPTMTQGSIDCDFQPAEREACQGLRGVLTRSAPGDPDEVLQIVSRHFAPIRELREVVQSWGEGCAEGSCAAALRIPANFCDSVEPLPPCMLDPEKFPVLGPVSPFDFATRGEVHSFYVGKPPVCSAAPWEHFGILSSARALADWVPSMFAMRPLQRRPSSPLSCTSMLQLLQLCRRRCSGFQMGVSSGMVSLSGHQFHLNSLARGVSSGR